MRVLGRSRLRHRAPRTVVATPRGSLVVALPEAPDGRVPGPLRLPLIHGAMRWGISGDDAAAFLAALDVAPPGAVLDVQHCGSDSGIHALLAAAYSTRLVRALAPDGERAHTTRQAAATNALPVVVEERPLARGPGGRGLAETLDAYATRTALEPAVLRLAEGRGAVALLQGARELLTRRRPWVVLAGVPGRAHAEALDATAELGYRRVAPGVLAPDAAVEPAYRRRLTAWQSAWQTVPPSTGQSLGPTVTDPPSGAIARPAVIDLRDCEGVVS
jgi:hypothetical protein